MSSYAVCVITSPGHSDRARGLLELLVQERLFGSLKGIKLFHVHGLERAEWPGEYLADQEISLAARLGERGRTERLNAAVQICQQSEADYCLMLDADLWPVMSKVLLAALESTNKAGDFLGAAAMEGGEPEDVPLGGLWPKLFTLDLAWQRSKRLFPLSWDAWFETGAARAEAWIVPTLAGCLSASYFRRIVDTTSETEAKKVALDNLTRFYPLEPVLQKGVERTIWHAWGLVSGDKPQARANLLRQAKVDVLGSPTLTRLVEDDGRDWFDTAHPHPA